MRRLSRQVETLGVGLALLCLVLPGASSAGPSQPEPIEPDHPGLIRPEAQDRIQPYYPYRAALQGGPQAEVLVKVVVETTGEVSDAIVLESSQPGLGFEEAALAAARRWRYRPARLDWRKVRAYAYVEMSFSQPYELCGRDREAEAAWRNEQTPPPLGAPGDREPMALTRVWPDCPKEAFEVEATGDVLMWILVRTDGKVEQVCVIDSTNPGFGFEEAAVGSLLKWKYRPAKRGGKKVPMWIQFRMEFGPGEREPEPDHED